MIPSLTPFLTTLGPAGLLIVMAVVFAETGLLVGFFLPGDSLLFTAGVLTATGVLGLPYWVVALGILVAALLGYQAGYLIGRRIGPRLFTRPDSRFFSQENALRAHDFVERHGAIGIVLARFVPVVRTFAPVVAGVGSMQPRRFLACNLAGGAAWVLALVTLGYFLGGVPFIAGHVEVFVLTVVALSLVPAAVTMLRRRGAAPKPAPCGPGR